MKKNTEIIKAQIKFENTFYRRILGTYYVVPKTEKEEIEVRENRDQIMTLAYRALTKFVIHDELAFMKTKAKWDFDIERCETKLRAKRNQVKSIT